jgi:beta-lactamase regulating signal transducer with metallopeptidase domain
MHADRYLYAISVFLTFSIRVAVVWFFCFIFSQVLRRPGHRFTLWLFFALGSAAYWLESLASVVLSSANATHATSHAIPLSHIAVSSTWEPVFAAVSWMLMGTYLIGLFGLCASRAWNRYRMSRLLDFGTKPSPEFALALEALCKEMGVKRCELLVMPGIVSPATVYWLKPRILFPEACHRTERMHESVHIMRHELVHIVRRDYLLSSVIDVVCTLLFFHPAVWSARKKMRLERELACDRAVVEACPDHRADYAASLAQFVRLSFMAKSPSHHVHFAAPSSLLGKRIRTILFDADVTPAWNRLCSAGLIATTVMTIVLFTPQASLSFDLNQSIAPAQFASTSTTPGFRMKRHVRFDYSGVSDPDAGSGLSGR